MQLIDTHSHINFDRYDEDRAAVVHRATAAGVSRIIVPAVDLKTAQECVDLTAMFEGVYAAVGVHPNSTADFNDAYLPQLEALIQAPKIIAIGEIGLDYHWDKSPPETQKRAFKAQLALAKKLELPVIIHNREASEDVLDILEDYVQDLPAHLKDRPGVMHSFSAPASIAKRAIDAGFYMGFTGPLTFKKADDLRSIAREVPLDRLLIETDAPFLTPEPYRGKRNEPAYVVHVADRLAALRGITTEEMAVITTQNAERLFALA